LIIRFWLVASRGASYRDVHRVVRLCAGERHHCTAPLIEMADSDEEAMDDVDA